MSYVSGSLSLENVEKMESQERRLRRKLDRPSCIKHVTSGAWKMVTRWQACPIGSVYSAPLGRQWDATDLDHDEPIDEQSAGGAASIGEGAEP